MASLAEIRAKYPQYKDLSDQQLADGLYKKFYSDLPRADFDQKLGIVAAPAVAANSQTSPVTPPAPEPYNQGYVSQGLSGINEGIANGLGAPVDLMATGLNLGIAGLNKLFPTDRNLSNLVTGEEPPPRFQYITDPFGGSGTFRGLLAPTIAPETDDRGKQFVRRTAQDVGASMLPSGLGAHIGNDVGLMGSQLGMALLSGMGGATAEQVAPGNATAETIGEGLGMLGGAGAMKLGQKLITPFEMPLERQAAVNTMRQEGVDLTAGQQVGSKKLQYNEAGLSGDAATRVTDRQAEQFTNSVLRRAGVNANRATPDVVDQAFTNNGNEFDTLAANNVMPMDRQLSTDLADSVRTYNSNTNPSARAPVINETLQDLVSAARQNGNQLAGSAYQDLRSRLERSARGTKDPQLATALRDIKGSLDDAMERGMVANGSPDVDEWRRVRNEYRNLLVVEQAAGGAGEQAAAGIISPAALRQATKNVYGRRSYARGRSDYSRIAHAGQQTMTPLPQSGTAPRLMTKLAPSGLTASAAAMMAGQPGAAAVLAGGSVAPWLAGKAIMSRPGQAYLANQLLAGRGPTGMSFLGPTGGIVANQLASPQLLGNALLGGP